MKKVIRCYRWHGSENPSEGTACCRGVLRTGPRSTPGNSFFHLKAVRAVRTIHKSRSVLLIISLEIKPSNLFHVQISLTYHILKVTRLAKFCLFTPDTKLCISSQLLQHLRTILQTGQNKGDIPAGWAALWFFSLIIPSSYQAGNNWLKHRIRLFRKNLGRVLAWELFYTQACLPGLPNRKQGHGLTWRVPAPLKGKISFSFLPLPPSMYEQRKGAAHQRERLLLKMCDSR